MQAMSPQMLAMLAQKSGQMQGGIGGMAGGPARFSGGTPNAPGRPAAGPVFSPSMSDGTPNAPGRPAFDPQVGPPRFFREPNAPGRPAFDPQVGPAQFSGGTPNAPYSYYADVPIAGQFNPEKAQQNPDAIQRAASLGVSRNSAGSNMLSGIQTIGSFFNNLNGAPPEVSTPDPLTPMQGYLGGPPAPTTFSSNIYGNASSINEPQVPVSVDQPQSPMQMFQDRQPPRNQILGGQNPTSSPYGNQLPSPYSGQYGFNRPPAPTLPAFDNMAGQNFQPRPQYSGPPNYLDMLDRGQTGLRAFGSYK